MRRKFQTIYEYFSNYPKEEIDIAISKLTEEEQKIVFLYSKEENNNLEKDEKWNREYSQQFYRSIVPKLKRLLANPEIKTRKTRKKINAVMKKEPNLNVESTPNEKDGFSNMLELTKTPTFAQLLSTLSTKEAVIISLRLGLVDGNFFSTETIAQFLGLTENEVREITRKVLLVYKENMNALLDSIIDAAIESDMKR